MSIHFIYGKPGGGKSRFAAEKGLIELLRGARPIFTNLAYLPGEVAAYCKKEGIELNLFERLHILDDDQTRYFWSYRPGPMVDHVMEYTRVPILTKEQWLAGHRPDYSKVKDGGVMYIIDEVQNYYNSREWQLTGRDLLFYNSQHRKRGDTCIFITQHLDNVDKQLRTVAQDFTKCFNMTKIKVSFWSMPKLFVWETRLSDSEIGPVSERGQFTLDVGGIAKTYDTSQGVSMVGGSVADTKEKQKGIPWWVGLLLLAAVLVGLLYFIPKAIMHVISGAISPKAVRETTTAALQAARGKTNETAKAQSKETVQQQQRSGEVLGSVETNTSGILPVTVVGYQALSRVAEVWFSDGTVYKGAFKVGPNGVLIENQIFKWHRQPWGTNESQTKFTPQEMNTYATSIKQPPIIERQVFLNDAGLVIRHSDFSRDPVVDVNAVPAEKSVDSSVQRLRHETW